MKRSEKTALREMGLTIDTKPNCTALALIGHTLIKNNLYDFATEKFKGKYHAASVWEMAPGAAGDKLDHQIKREFAAKHPYDPVLGKRLAEIFSDITIRSRGPAAAEPEVLSLKKKNIRLL